MKRGFLILLAAVVLLTFWGCRPDGRNAAITAATTETTAPVPTRPEKIQLEFFLEGMSEYQDATLFVGDGYSLYITDDSWITAPGENGAVTWTSSYNPDITLTLIPNAGSTIAQAQERLFAAYPNVEAEGEYVYGSTEDSLYFQTARLIETREGVVAAVWCYTLEAAEGWGARLRVMASTLEAT